MLKQRLHFHLLVKLAKSSQYQVVLQICSLSWKDWPKDTEQRPFFPFLEEFWMLRRKECSPFLVSFFFLYKEQEKTFSFLACFLQEMREYASYVNVYSWRSWNLWLQGSSMLSLRINCLILHHTILNDYKITMYPVFHLTKHIHSAFKFYPFQHL